MADAQANINVNINTADALAQIRALQRQLSSFYSAMSKGGGNASAQVAVMQQNLINGINSSGKFSASLTTVRSTTESFTNALEKNKLSMGEYFRYAGGSSKTFGKLFRTEFETINKVARERVKTLQTQFIRLGRDANGAMQAIQVRPLALDMENLGTKVMMTAQKQQLFNQLVKQGSTNLLNFGKNTQWAGRQLMVGFTIPLSIFGAAAIREFQKIEEQAIKFRRVYGDMFSTDADADKALDNIRKLAEEFTKYGIAVEKTIELAAKVAQMGNVGEALEQQVIQATRLSVLGGLEQQEALDTTISLTNAFGVSVEDLADKINFLNAAENQTILSIEDFNTAIPLAGSVVQQLGGDVEDLAFFLTAMREGGINASQGANALKTSLARLINPTTAAKERLAEMGINVMGIVESNVGDLKGTVMSLAVELDKLDPLTRARAIEQLFGKFQFARMSTLFQNIVKEGSQANKVLQLTQNNTEELAILANRELGRVEESAATKFQRSLEKIQAALAPLGEEFLKAITPIVEFGTKLLNSFNNLSDGTKKFVTNIVGFVGLVAPVFLMGLGLVFNLIANGIKAFQFLGGVLLGLSGKSKVLGSGLNYLSQEQLEGLAASGSLEQAHINLRQAFTSEKLAIDMLIQSYRAAAIAQRSFGGVAIATRATTPQGFAQGKQVPGYSKGKKVPGYSNGVFVVPGKTSDGDAQPAMLTAGEAVISEPMTRKYGGLINAMIADNIPGYATSKPAKIDYGGASYGVSASNMRGVLDEILAIERAGAVVPEVLGMLSQALKELASQGRLTGDNLRTLVDEQSEGGLTLLRRTQPVTSAGGAGGLARAHGMPGFVLDQEQKAAFAGYGAAGDMVANASTARASSNLVFGMPAAFNAGNMTGAEGASFIDQNPEDFTSFIAQQYNLDPSDPALASFSANVAEQLRLAGDAAVDDSMFFEVIRKALAEEIDAVGSAASTEVRKAFDDARKVSTVQVTGEGGRSQRVPVPAPLRGQDLPGGIETAEAPSYRAKGRTTITPEAHGRADDLVTKVAEQRMGISEDSERGVPIIAEDPSRTSELKILGRQDGSEGYSDGFFEATSERMANFIDNITKATGHNSPHPFWKPQGVEDGQAYGEGYNQGSAETIASPGSSGLTPPPPPPKGSPLAPPPPPGTSNLPQPKAKPSVGKRVADRILDSAPSKAVGKFLAKQSGIAVSDSKGEVFYDPNEDESTEFGRMTAEARRQKDRLPGGKDYVPPDPNAPPPPSAIARQINTELRDKGFITDDLQQTPLGVASGIVPVKVVDGKIDIGDNSIDNLANVSPTANEAAESDQVTSARKDNRAAADKIAGSNEALAKTTEKSTKERQQIEQEDKRQKRQQRAGRALGALGTATMVAGMATQVDGVVGEIAQQAVGPLAALSGIAPILMSLPAPLALLVTLLGSLAGAIYLNKQAMEKAYDETYKLSRAMGVGSEALQKFATFAGTVGSSEVMDRKRQERLSQFVVQPGKTTFGSAFTASDEGKEFVGTVRTSLNELGRDQTINSVFSQLGNAVAQNMLTQEQARSIAGNLGIALGDVGIGMEVNAKLIELLGPNGENLINDPLLLQVKLAEIQAENVQEVMDEYLEKQKVLDPFTQMGGLGGALELQVGTVQGGDLDALNQIVTEEKQKRYDEGGFWSDIATFFTPPTSIAEQIMQEQLGSVGAAVANSMGQQQQIIDAIRLQSEEKIAKAIEEGATYDDIQKLREEEAKAISDAIDAVNEQTKKSVELIDSLSSSDQKEQQKQLRQRLLEQELPDGVSKSAVGNAFDKIFSDGDFKVNFLLSSAYEGGQFSFEEFKYISSLPQERKQIYYDISMNLGSGESSQLAQISNLIQDETIKADFELSFSGLKGAELTDAISQAEELFKLGNMLGGDISIAADFALKNPETMQDFMSDLDRIKFDAKEGGFDANIELMTTIFGAEEVMAMQAGILANQAEFDALPDEMQLQYGAYFTLFADIAASTPELQALMEQATGLKGDAATAAYLMDYMPSLMPDMATGPGDGEGPAGGGGGGSPEAFDPLIKKLRDLRLATIDMKRGWDGMMQSLQKVFEGGTKSINVFDGLSNQIRKLGVGENLIEMIVGMDPDEYNKRKKDLFVFDKAGNITGVTAKLKNMQSAFNAIALGEYVNQQQRSLQSMRDQISAISILTANGLSLAEAYELVQDEALAAAIAMGATREEIQEIIRITKELASVRKRSEKEQEKADAAKAVRKTNEEFQKRVDVLRKLSQSAGQYTDEQINAIMSDSNLQTLFLNPSIDKKALEQALYNAAKNAEIELQVRLSTTEGKKGVWEEGFGKAMEAFATQEQTINLKFQADISGDESIVREAESQIAELQYQLDDYQAEITRIEDQEKDINDAYEKRFEALDKIAQANEQIAAAQKSQLDIADALTRGDIAAAARAAQEARSQQAQSAQQSERERLERARDAQLGRLTGRGGMNREQLEEQIRQLEMQIFNIEEDNLEPAQERIRRAEEARDAQIRSLEVLGKTRSEWEQIQNSIDVATMNSWQFVEAMENALDVVSRLLEELGLPKPESAPISDSNDGDSSGGGGGGTSAALTTSTKQGGSSSKLSLPTPGANYPSTGGLGPNIFGKPKVVTPQATNNLGANIFGTAKVTTTVTPVKPTTQFSVSGTATKQQALKTASSNNLGAGIYGKAPTKKADGGLIRMANGGMIIPKRMAMGGRAKGYPMGGLIPYKAAGGFFKSLGSDTIPAMLTPGEFVVRRPAVRGFGVDKLEKINNGTYSNGSVYTYNLAVNVKSNSDPDRIARTVMKHIERVDSQKIKGNRI
jgi:TP901 family phage tail tape measure protein